MAWLTGFNNRIKLTIPPDNVDNNLTDFPVMLYFSSNSGRSGYDTTAVFDELSDENYKRIAVTTSDGTTQCPVEIEYWSSIEEKAYLWTKVPTIYSSVDTDLYFYYDATYSGTTISGNEDYVGDINDMSYEMVVDYNIEGTYDTTNVLKPFVIKESDTSYKMWYGGNDGTYWRIMYATSVDGISWSGHQMVIDINQETNYDTNGLFGPHVIKESDTSYKMWYSGNNNSNWRIIYATSTNGTSWSNYQMVVGLSSEGTYDIVACYHPHVIKESDTSYKMWYSGYDGSNWRIIYADSLNGTTWSNFELILENDMEGTYDDEGVGVGSCVILEDNVMWYCGYSSPYWRIMRATYWDTPAQNVWDDNFVGVWHMSQDPSGGADAVLDSTKNINHGTSGGSMTTGALVDGKTGKALDFDGNNDVIDLDDKSDWNFGTSDVTLECFVYGSLNASSDIMSRWGGSNPNYGFEWILGSTGSVSFYLGNNTAAFTSAPAGTVAANTWYYMVINRSGNNFKFYLDDVVKSTGTNSATMTSSPSTSLYFMARGNQAIQYNEGKLDEVRISNISRSDAWIKANYHSGWDNFVVFQDEEITTNWLTDWSKRIKLTIDNTNIDNTLTDFPLSVTLVSGTNTGAVFDELISVSGTKKIAITTDDGVTQCPVEIERWDYDNGQATLWTKVPVIDNDENTILYLYYDVTKDDNTTYVGDTGDAVAQTVWDSNFIGVWHLSQSPTRSILDSTGDGNHGTSGAGLTSDNLVDGVVGKAIRFDATNPDSTTDYIDVGSDNFNSLPAITLECIYKPLALPSDGSSATPSHNDHRFIDKFWDGTDRSFRFGCSATTDKISFQFSTDTLNDNNGGITSNSVISVGNVYCVAACWDGNTDDTFIYVDGVKQTATYSRDGNTTRSNTSPVYIGAQYYNNMKYSPTDGIIDEVRISNIARSDAWTKATYYSNMNTILTYGIEQQRPIFLFYGYVKVAGIPAARTVHLYRRATGELIESVVSNSVTGYFEIGSYYNDYHFVVILPELTEGYNLIAYDQIHV